MAKKTLFYSRNRANANPLHFAAWDCETAGLGGKLLCITTAVDHSEPKFFDGPNCAAHFLEYAFEAWPWSKTSRQVWASHNLGYDLRYIIAHVLEHLEEYAFGEMGLRTDQDFWCFEIIQKSDGTIIRFVDSLAVFPRSLKEFASQFGGEFCKLEGPDFAGGELFDPANADHQRYALRDAQALLSSLHNYSDLVRQDYGVELGYTAAGTAIRAWQATIPEGLPYFRQSRPAREFIRRGYYGGLVFLTDSNPVAGAVTYDINSSYPAAMRRGVPLGKVSLAYDYLTVEEAPGFYECEVEAPVDLIVPILPYRTERGGVQWLRGKFSGVYSNLEIDFARKHGYRVKTGNGFVFEELGFPFDDFIDLCERIRRECKGTPRETVAKLMQNSTYGKFASKETRRVLFVSENDEDTEGAIPWGEDGYFWVRMEDQSEEMLNKIEWGAWITASARVALLSVVYALGSENCIYGDTDSITVRPDADYSLVPCSDAYGDFKREKEWEQFRAIAPKCYAGIIKGKSTGKSKGQRRRNMTEGDWSKLFAEGHCEIQSEQLPNILQTLKHGVQPAKSVLKASSDLLNSSSYVDIGGGVIRPRSVKHEI